MNRMIRAAAAAAVLTGGLGSVGCVHSGSGGGPDGSRYRNLVDPCYPERYNHAARQATHAPFAQQVHNGYVLNQTIWNYYFEDNTDKLTPAGREKLDSLARVRPAPDPKLYIQAARDVPMTADTEGKLPALRDDLNLRRAMAIQKYMATQPALVPVAYEIFVHDAAVPSINSEMAAGAYRGSFLGYRGGITGGAGIGALGTGSSSLVNITTGGGAGGGAGAAPGGGGTGGGTGGGGTGGGGAY